jgi:hypothetical protein
MEFQIKTVAYNEYYINHFLEYSFPSLLSPNNIPAVVKSVTAKFDYNIYTHTQEEADRINNRLGKYNEYFSLKAQIAPIEEYHFHNEHPQSKVFDYFTVKNPETMPTLFSNADWVWADGSLMHVVSSLRKGNVAVFPPIMRVTAETLNPELGTFKENGVLPLSSAQVQRLIIKHLLPYQAAMHPHSLRFPPWHEVIFVPVGTEGVLAYHVGRPFSAFAPRKFGVVNCIYVNEDYYTYPIDTVKDANQCIVMELQSIAHKDRMDLHRQGIPFSVHDVAEFMKNPRWGNPLAFNITSLQIPLRIHLVEKPTEELWREVEENTARGIIDEIIYSNAIKSSNSPIIVSDRQMQIEALEWLEPVINGRFKQAVLDYLRNNLDGVSDRS